MSKFDRFKHPTNGALYAFVEAPVQALATPLPVGAKWGTIVLEPAEYDEEGNETKPAVTRQKTIGEFVLSVRYSLDDSKVIVVLAAMEAPCYRTNGVNDQDLAEWEAFMTPAGFPVSAWLDLLQYHALVSSPAYSEPDADV